MSQENVSGTQDSPPDPKLLELLDRWAGSDVAVRVVVDATDELIAVFAGRLQARSDEKPPALFWPLQSVRAPDAERLGVYLHPGSHEGSRIHPGEFVVEYRQAGVIVNVRRLQGERGPVLRRE
jgi:hypothetical protein